MIENIQMSKWIFIASFFSALTVIIIKQYQKTSNNWLLLLTVLSEVALIYSYIKLLKNENIITIFSLVKIISILIVIVSSIRFFGSELTIKQIVGIIFAIIAIYLLN